MRSQSPPDLGPCVELIVQVLLLHQELVQEPLSNSNAVTVLRCHHSDCDFCLTDV